MNSRHEQGGIMRILKEAGGLWLIALALIANLAEGIGKTFIASNGGKMIDAISALDRAAMNDSFWRVVLFVLLMGVGIIVKDTLLGVYQERGMVRLRQRTITSLGRARMDWLASRHSGELSARASSDLSALGGALRPVLIMGISVILAGCVSVAYMFMTNWQLTLIIFSLVPLTVALQWLYSRPLASYRAAHQDATGDVSAAVYDAYGSLETVKSLTMEGDMRKRFKAAQDKQYDSAIGETKVVAMLTPLSMIGRYLPQFLLILIGGTFVISGRITIGEMAMFLALSQFALRILDDVRSLIAAMRKLNVAADRIVELWDLPTEREGGVELAPDGKHKLLEFDSVSFAYSDDRAEGAIKNISLSVDRGDFIALVGGSGSGKSTAMKLAAALYSPSGGSISLLGVDQGDWSPDHYREHIAYVSQDTWLFSGTIRDNIASGRPDATDADILGAARAAGLDAFLAASPDGLNTQLGERGVTLSGGQRLRIAIARALIKKADLLLLDEATSALDQSTEAEVIASLLDLRERPAILMITHKLANARTAGEIIVMRHGEIIERGSHERLISRGGEYAKLIASSREGVTF